MVAHHLAEMDKGTGLVMCCTFGDLTDVLWWRELDLPVRTVIGRDGRLARETPAWLASEAAASAYERLAGKTVFSAREEMVAVLRESGDLDGEPKPTMRMANFYENGDKPLEIVATRQWYIRNGGRDPDVRAEMLEHGAEITWLPPHMKIRYDNWVSGLTGDWLISRQRFFGIPFPVWYPLDGEGEPDYAHPLMPAEAELPVDPSTDAPRGYTEDQRGKPNGFIGDPDVMDTWATSSLTPQIAGGWSVDDDLFGRVFPMDLCTQAHEIIRTWLFSRVVRAHYENHATPVDARDAVRLDPRPRPQEDVEVQGQRGRPDRDPGQVRRRRGALAGRHGAAWHGLAVRRDPDEGRPPAGHEGAQRLQVRPGRRRRDRAERRSRSPSRSTARCSAGWPPSSPPRRRRSRPTTTPPPSRRPSGSSGSSATTTSSWSRSAPTTRRADRPRDSARATLALALQVQLRLLAPFLPYVTEEVWSWWQEGSIHRAAWPTVADLGAAAAADPATLDAVAAALIGIRGAKSQAKVSMRHELTKVRITGPEALVRAAELAADDLRKTGRITGKLKFTVDESATELSVDAELAPVDSEG